MSYTATIEGVDYVFHFDDQRIDVPASLDTLEVTKLWEAVKKCHASEPGITYGIIADASGLDELDPGVSTFLTMTLQELWEVNSLKASGKFTTKGGNLRRADGEDPFRDNPLVTYIAFLSQAGTAALIESGVSGLTPAESAQLLAIPTTPAPTAEENAATVWTEELEGPLTATDMQRILLAVLAGEAVIPQGDGSYSFRSQDGGTVRVSGTVSGTGRTPD